MNVEAEKNLCGEDAVARKPIFKAAAARAVVGWIALASILDLHFCLTYLSNPFFLDMERYVAGEVKTPFQYRVLPMYVYRLLIHTRAVTGAAAHLPYPLNNAYSLIFFGIAFLSVAGAVLATSATIARLTGDRGFARWMSLLVVYMAYFNLAPHWGLGYTLPYDAPSLCFFCLGVYLVVSRRWWIYYVMFPIAIFNRETICFLTVFFVVWEWFRRSTGPLGTEEAAGRKASRLSVHVLIQGLIWCAIELYLAHRFAANPKEGGGTDAITNLGLHLRYNLQELAKPQQWPVFLSIGGFLFPALWMSRKWILNPQMSWGCGIVIFLWFAGMMNVGIITEIRIFSECTALVVPALALAVYNRFLLGSPQRTEVAALSMS